MSEGIWKAVVLAEEGPGTNFHVTNEYVARFAHRDSSATLIAFGGINPRRAAPAAAYDEAIALGVRGFKLYPADHDFDPCHPDLMDVYGRMAAARVPIMFHTGHTAQTDANHDYCNPLVFAPIMRAIPSLCVILCHAGMPASTEEARWCLAHFPIPT